MVLTLDEINALYKEYLHSCWSDMWKKAFSGIDPNDLQAQDKVLWGSNKPCCGGANGPGPYYASGGSWHSADCDTLKPPQMQQSSASQPAEYKPQKSFWCECGASSTSNPNCHATYCPAYKK